MELVIVISILIAVVSVFVSCLTIRRVKRQILLWSSVFVTLVAKKYRFMQFELDRVFDTR